MYCSYRSLKIIYSSLMLLPALIAAVVRDHEQSLRDELCQRVCPDESPTPPTLVPGAPPLAECPDLQCPAPVCPKPVCPSSSSPPACLACSGQSVAPPDALAWKTLKAQTYTSTPLGYYKYYNDKNMDWFDAQMFCESEGAHLLILNSQQEDMFIRNAILPGWIHIGIHYFNPIGSSITVLGQPVNSTGFSYWLPGHIHRNDTTKCGFINKSSRGLGMGRCSDVGPFICEL